MNPAGGHGLNPPPTPGHERPAQPRAVPARGVSAARRAVVRAQGGAQAGRTAALGLAAGVGGLFLGRRLLGRHYLGPLRRRTLALRGARYTLQRVRPVHGARPGWPEAWILEITVRPRPARRGFARWRPRDLALVAPGARPGHPEEDDEVGRILGVQVLRKGAFRPLDDEAEPNLAGPQTLRLRIALRRGTRHFLLRYYLEILRRAPR